MGNKPLTWQQIIAVVCVPALLIGGGLAFGTNVEPEGRNIGLWILAIALPTVIGAMVSHSVVHRRRDLQPDVLARMFAPRELMQLGDAQLWISARQDDDHIAIPLVVQNTRDGPGELVLELRARKGGDILAHDAASVPLLLSSAEVQAAVIELPIRRVTESQRVQFLIGGRCKGR